MLKLLLIICQLRVQSQGRTVHENTDSASVRETDKRQYQKIILKNELKQNIS